MSKTLRLLLAAFAALAGSLVVTPGTAFASFGPDMEFTMATTVTVGDTDLPASITLTNGSDGNEEGFTAIICNQGDNPPCIDPGTATPDDDIGINLILSCGGFGASTTCSSADPGVFRPSPTGTGRAGTECDGVVFDIVDYNPAFGSLRFTPQGGNVSLVDPGDGCIIDFTVDVIGTPTIDSSAADGIQTGQLGDVTAYSDNADLLPGEASDTRNITVLRATPSISTVASPSIALGSTITDRATITGRVFPEAAADVTFTLFGPDDDLCANPPVFTSTVSINATDTQIASEPFAPVAVGTYYWIASYAGDANNEPVSGECGDPNESVVVTQAQPTLTTAASDTINLGGDVTDTATVTGRIGAQASTVTFALYGPDDETCAGPAVFTDADVELPVDSDSVISAAFTPTETGTYRWIATYSGDTNNEGAVGECGDPAETVEVLLAAPTIVTQASPNVALDVGVLFDEATVVGRIDPQPGATVSFRLYGPGDATCSADPVFEDLDVAYPVAEGPVRSASYTPTVVGVYRWVASYSGDANNLPAVGECGDPLETVTVTAPPVTELPATGSETDWMVRSGGLLVLAGAALLSLGRRRRLV